MILMIDNYDSFTYNIIHYLEGMDYEVVTKTPDSITVQQIKEMQPEAIIISPGPGHPDDAVLAQCITLELAGQIPILGICLGLQVIVTAFGGEVSKGKPVHGHAQHITHDGKGMFTGLDSPLTVARYHSLQATKVPEDLIVTARAGDIVMGVRHKNFPIEAVQYHPESILTEHGKVQLDNFFKEYVR